MAQTIKIKRSSTSGNKLTSSNSVAGELGLNTADKALYIQTGSSNGDVVTIAHESTLKIDEVNGRIGIGTTSPGTTLDVNGDIRAVQAIYSEGSSPRVQLQDTDGTNQFSFFQQSTSQLSLRLRNDTSDGSFLIAGYGGTTTTNRMLIGSTGDLTYYRDDGSTTALFLDASNGNFGIGTNSPDEALVVSGDGARIYVNSADYNVAMIGRRGSSGVSLDQGYIRLKDQGTNKVVLDSAGPSYFNGGNVGIGTTSPVQKLDVDDGFIRVQSPDVGGVAPPVLTIGQINNAYQAGITSSIHVSMKAANNAGNFYWYPNSNNPIMILTQAGNLGIGSTSPSEKLQVTGTIKQTGTYNLTLSDGANITGSNHVYVKANSSYVRIDAPSNSIYYNAGTDHVFRNGDGSTEYMRIDTNGTNAGNVGIGTTAPDNKLHVYKGNSGHSWSFDGGDGLILENSDSLSINITTPAANSGNILFSDANARGQGRIVYDHSSDYMGFMTAGVSNEHVRITSTGHVGIGTTNPVYTLVVSEDGNDNIEIGAGIIQRYNRSSSTYQAMNYYAYTHNFYTTGGGHQSLYIKNDGNVAIGTSTPYSGTNVRSLTVNAPSYPALALQIGGNNAGLLMSNSSGTDLYALGNKRLQFITNDTTRIRIAGTGGVTFNEEYTFPTEDGSANQVLKTDGSGNLSFVTIAGAGAITEIEDADGDTKIQVEESADEDKIRFDIAGTEKVILDSSNFSIESGGFRVDDPGNNYPFRVTQYGYMTSRGVSATQLNATGDHANVPLSVLADVNSTRTASYVEIGDIGSAGNRFKIDNSGRVGINQTNPSHKLQVSVDANGAFIERNIGSNAANLSEFNSHRSLLLLNRNAGSYLAFGGNSSRTDIQATDLAGTPTAKNISLNPFGGSVSVGVTSPGGVFDVDGTYGDFTVGNPSVGSRLTYYDTTRITLDSNNINFYTNSLTERMRIDSSGNVGIGTTSPAGTLHVVGTGARIDTADGSGLTINRPGNSAHLHLFPAYSSVPTIMGDGAGGLHLGYNSNTDGIRIDTSNRVGIGTTSPAKTLDVAANGSSQGIHLNISGVGRLQMYADGDRNYFKGLSGNGHRITTTGGANVEILNNGNVGIGTTSPEYILDIGSENADNPTDFIRLNPTNGNGAGTSNTLGTGLVWKPHYTSYTKRSAGIVQVGEGNYFRSGLAFYTNNTADTTTDWSERMRIDMDGNVGIGTNAPARPFHVVAGTGTVPTVSGIGLIALVQNNSATDSSSGVGILSGNAANGSIFFGDAEDADIGKIVYEHNNNALAITTNATERMRIDSSGNVGIGTTSPQSFCRLDVRSTGASGAAGIAAYGYASNGTAILGNGYAGSAAGTNYGIRGLSTGPRGSVSGSVNVGGHFEANGAVSNYALTTGAGNVGIGTTSPDAKFEVEWTGTNVSTDSISRITAPIYPSLEFYSTNTNTNNRNWKIASVYNSYGTLEFLRSSAANGVPNITTLAMNNAGNVGIGISSPTSNLHVKTSVDNSVSQGIIVERSLNSDRGYINYTGGAFQFRSTVGDPIVFGETDAEHMRILPDGDWAVSNTVANVASGYSTQGGCGWVESDNHFEVATTSNRSAAEFGRNNANSGDVITIRQQSASVGMIGTEGGDSLVIQSNGSTGSGLRFHPSAASIQPVRQGVTIDDTISLGADTRRFKDLHLSNAANIGHASIETSSTSTTATTQVAIDTMAAATFRSAKYTIQVTNSTDSTYHITEILLIHDGTTPGITEYGTVFTGSAAEATFDADISSGNVRLLATPASTDSMTFKVVRHCITV